MKEGDRIVVRCVFDTPVPWPPQPVTRGGSRDAWAEWWKQIKAMGITAEQVLEGDNVLITSVKGVRGNEILIETSSGYMWIPSHWVRPITTLPTGAIRRIVDPRRRA